MGESLIQPSRVEDDCPTGCKLLLYEKKRLDLSGPDGIL